MVPRRLCLQSINPTLVAIHPSLAIGTANPRVSTLASSLMERAPLVDLLPHLPQPPLLPHRTIVPSIATQR